MKAFTVKVNFYKAGQGFARQKEYREQACGFHTAANNALRKLRRDVPRVKIPRITVDIQDLGTIHK